MIHAAMICTSNPENVIPRNEQTTAPMSAYKQILRVLSLLLALNFSVNSVEKNTVNAQETAHSDKKATYS